MVKLLDDHIGCSCLNTAEPFLILLFKSTSLLLEVLLKPLKQLFCHSKSTNYIKNETQKTEIQAVKRDSHLINYLIYRLKILK